MKNDVTVELRTFVAKRYDQNVMQVVARVPETIETEQYPSDEEIARYRS